MAQRCFWTTGLVIAPPGFEAEEGKAVPLGAGNRARDGRQGLVGGGPEVLEISVPHRDAVLDALILPDQPCPGNRPGVRAHLPFRLAATIQFLAEFLQPPDCFRLKAAIGQFLDAVRQSALEIPAIERRWLGLEQIAPLLLELRRRRRLQCRQSRGGWGQDRHAILRLDGVA